MPRYRTHLFVGFFAYLVVYLLAQAIKPLSASYTLCGLIACLVGSLFPDIDIQSRMRNLFYTALALLLCTAILIKSWLWFAVGSCAALGVALLSHRTITHRIWFLILGPLPLCLLASSMYKQHSGLLWFTYTSFVIGACSHVTIDYRVSSLKRWWRR